MKPHETPDQNRLLQHALQQWTVDASLPPRFRENVWKRVSRADGAPSAGFWATLARLLAVVLPRPRVAFSYLALLLAVGVAGGALAAQIKTRRLQSELGLRYMQSIDPYLGHSSNP
jgi:hypothetical protein